MMEWQPIETAPRGSGEDGPSDTRHPKYVKPPIILIYTPDGCFCGSYEWYYHEGYGNGAQDGVPAWRETLSDEPIYNATHWMPLPPPPKDAA